MNESAEEARPRRNPLLVPVRWLLHELVKLLVLLVVGVRLVLRPRAVRYGLPVLVVLGLVGWQLLAGYLPGTTAKPLAASGGAVQGGDLALANNGQTLPPSAVVERYLQAQAGFDGVTMWGLLSDDMKTNLEVGAAIANAQQLQVQLDSGKAAGRKYLAATYAGGMALSDGSSVYFYVLQVGDAENNRGEVPYIYVVGADGKIASIQ
jgi:hypothetical protein